MKHAFSFLSRILEAVFCVAIAAGSHAFASDVMLEDKLLVAIFDSDSGALTGLENKATHWAIEQRPPVGIPFRLSVRANNKDNVVLGQKQHAAKVVKVSDGRVELQWEKLVAEDGTVLPITLTAAVSLTNGTLRFDTTIENNSGAMVSTIDFPYLSDLKTPAEGGALNMSGMSYASLDGAANVKSCKSLFCLICSPSQGLYVEMRDATQPYLIDFICERSGGNKSDGNAARQEFRASHFAYVHPHTTAHLAPVVLRFFQGDWHAGVDYYKQWRATWFKQPRIPDWIKEVNSWQQLQIDSPEQDWRVPYADLVKYGDECAKNGVGAMQLVGWNKGGQDGGDPSQDTDPNMGTWQQLHDAIAHIQARGVKVILFGKLNWADLTTPWYSSELHKYECTNENGGRYGQGGYCYYTPTQLGGDNVHTRAVMDFLDPEYGDIAVTEFKKILALGSVGWLWDEVNWHSDVLYSWAPNHGYTPPGYIYAGDMPLSARLRAAADHVSPDFLFAGEAPQDWLQQYFPCSYFRIVDGSVPVCRYIDPYAPLMVAVTGFDDREMLNLILLYRYIISYEPYNFKGHLGDYPLTLAYGKKIDALRRKYREYLWDAEFKDTVGATVKADGGFHYSVFVTSRGKRAVVIVNKELSRTIAADVELPHPGPLLVATPEEPNARPATHPLQIPCRSAAVLMEQ